MKVYISVDIEGVTGVTDWKETELSHGEHEAAAKQMKAEALAACEGALAAGATEIWMKDSHDSGRNMWIDGLPKEVKLIRGWMCSPDSMVAGVDESFDAALCIGYHSEGGVNGNPLAHTMTSDGLFWVKINGRLASELEYHTYVCAKYGVPMVFVSGDQALCDKAVGVIPNIKTVATKQGIGSATINRNGETVCEEIRATVKAALLAERVPVMPEVQNLTLELCFRQHFDARRASFYPGAELADAYTVKYKAKNIREMLVAFMFMNK